MGFPRARRAAGIAVLAAALAAPPVAPAASRGRVALTPDGTAQLSWSHNDGGYSLVQGRSRAPDGTLGDVEFVSPTSFTAVGPVVAPGAGGSALHAWRSVEPGGSVVRIRRRAADGSLSAPQAVSGPGAYVDLEMESDAAGNAVIVWTRTVDGKRVLEIRRRAANGALSPVKRLSAASPSYHASSPSLDLDAAGNAVVAWTVAAPASYVQVRRRAVDGTLSATQNLTSGSSPALHPSVGVDADGDAVIAFRRTRDGATFVQARRRSAAGTLGPLQDVSRSAGSAVVPQVAAEAGGAATVAWLRDDGEGHRYLQAVRRSATGTYGPVLDISVADGMAMQFRLGLDSDGNAILAWWRRTGTTSSVQIRRRSAAGALFPIQDLSPADGTVSDVDLAVDPGGGAVVTWVDAAMSPSQIKVRRRGPAGDLSPTQTASL